MPDETKQSTYVELAAEIVSAYVTKNAISRADLPELIANVHSALNKAGGATTEQPKEELRPAVPIKKSVTDDYIICLDDGLKFKSLKRHLRTAYNMTPEQYRTKWSLPSDYPMVSPNYSRTRSQLAAKMGLGQNRRTPKKRVRKAG